MLVCCKEVKIWLVFSLGKLLLFKPLGNRLRVLSFWSCIKIIRIGQAYSFYLVGLNLGSVLRQFYRSLWYARLMQTSYFIIKDSLTIMICHCIATNIGTVCYFLKAEVQVTFSTLIVVPCCINSTRPTKTLCQSLNKVAMSLR